MRKFIYAIASVFGIILINSCGLSSSKESQARAFLQQKVASESQGALKLDNFEKVNGYEQNSNRSERYTIEWQADISTQQEIWKSGNFLVGYWSDFGVMTKQPNSMDELAMASSSKHFNAGTMIRLTGNAYLQQTEKGWRIIELNVRTSQTISKGSATNGSNEGTSDPNSQINTKLQNLEAAYQKRTNLYTSVIKTAEASANFEKLTLEAVIEDWEKVASIKVDINNPETLRTFPQLQENLQSSFSRLISMFELYPDLKKTRAFLDFQTQIEGTENRINVARQEYEDLCKKYGRNDILLGSE